MIALIIPGIIALFITAVLLIPIGVDIAFEGGHLRVSAKAATFLLQVFPRPPASEPKPKEEKKPPQEKKPEQKKETKEKSSKFRLIYDLSTEEKIELLKIMLRSTSILGKKVRVDRFLLDYVAAGRDPYLTARVFGVVNAVINTLAPICSQRFDCKDLYVRTDVDFESNDMKLDFGLALTIRMWAILHMINVVIFKSLSLFIRHKMEKSKEKLSKETAGESEETQQISEKENIESNIQQEERNDENGK